MWLVWRSQLLCYDVYTQDYVGWVSMVTKTTPKAFFHPATSSCQFKLSPSATSSNGYLWLISICQEQHNLFTIKFDTFHARHIIQLFGMNCNSGWSSVHCHLGRQQAIRPHHIFTCRNLPPHKWNLANAPLKCSQSDYFKSLSAVSMHVMPIAVLTLRKSPYTIQPIIILINA